jgi:hypothetical protein
MWIGCFLALPVTVPWKKKLYFSTFKVLAKYHKFTPNLSDHRVFPNLSPEGVTLRSTCERRPLVAITGFSHADACRNTRPSLLVVTYILAKISNAPANILQCTAFLFNYFTRTFVQLKEWKETKQNVFTEFIFIQTLCHKQRQRIGTLWLKNHSI